MPLYRCQRTMNHDNGLIADAVVNTWHFNATSDAVLGDIEDYLDDFYGAFDEYLSPVLSGTGTYKWYDLAQPEPRVPVRIDNIRPLVLPSGGEPLPEELAICLTYSAPQAAGIPQARRRGRVYLGPWYETANASGAPDPTLIDAIKGAAGVLEGASEASNAWDWVVYSRKNNAAYAVDFGWVDNAFDIQRRRGRKATTRAAFT